ESKRHCDGGIQLGTDFVFYLHRIVAVRYSSIPGHRATGVDWIHSGSALPDYAADDYFESNSGIGAGGFGGRADRGAWSLAGGTKGGKPGLTPGPRVLEVTAVPLCSHT